jgi:glutamate N-acetyltransferase/amino-acid N-acetyltransferase
VLVASTGSIGKYLPIESILEGIERLAPCIGPGGGEEAARAIMTTDTFPKTAALEYSSGGGRTRIGGMTKGAGMIFPRMATTLSFIATDAAVEREELQNALNRAVDRSFNRITVDGDTSTNDCVFLFANGLSGNPPLKEGDAALKDFQDALLHLCLKLAKKIVQDGEGATKFIEVRVRGAGNEDDAITIARAIANSPLVKTACYGQDPNWGRIMAAAGSARSSLDFSKTKLYLNGIKVVENGLRAEGDWQETADEGMRKEQITIALDLGVGDAESVVWTTDLTEEYIRINAHYHT